MKVDIKSKLQNHLIHSSFEESDVVYILSRVRKLIELEGVDASDKYKELKFFCNWSLHIRIDDTRAISDLVRKMVNNTSTFKIYELFCTNFKSFLDDYGLRTSIFDSDVSKLNFLGKLSAVYQDTPLVVKNGNQTYEFTFTDSDIGIEELGDGVSIRSFGSTYRIQKLP